MNSQYRPFGNPWEYLPVIGLMHPFFRGIYRKVFPRVPKIVFLRALRGQFIAGTELVRSRFCRLNYTGPQQYRGAI